MEPGGVEQLRGAIDALAAADIVGVSQRDELTAMWCELTRLEAQFTRRIAELDTSVEWSVDGSRSAAGWLVANLRQATGEAHHRVKVATTPTPIPAAAPDPANHPNPSSPRPVATSPAPANAQMSSDLGPHPARRDARPI